MHRVFSHEFTGVLLALVRAETAGNHTSTVNLNAFFSSRTYSTCFLTDQLATVLDTTSVNRDNIIHRASCP